MLTITLAVGNRNLCAGVAQRPVKSVVTAPIARNSRQGSHQGFGGDEWTASSIRRNAPGPSILWSHRDSHSHAHPTGFTSPTHDHCWIKETT